LKKVALIFMVIFIFSSINSQLANPDPLSASSVKKVTVRSEIERGRKAAWACSSKTKLSTYLLIKHAENTVEEAAKLGKDTDAFKLGVYFGTWVNADVLASLDNSILEPQSKRQETADLYCSEYKKYQSMLKLTDKQLCNASNLNCSSILPDMKRCIY